MALQSEVITRQNAMEMEPFVVNDVSEPFQIVSNDTHNLDIADEDLLDQFDDEESDEIYQLMCHAKLALLRKLIAPLVIAYYVFISFIFIIPVLDLKDNTFIFQIIVSIPIILTFWSYFKASYSHPGRVPKQWLKWNGQLNKIPPYPIYCKLNESSGIKITENERLKTSILCKWCNNYRCFRTGHCSKCDQCIAHMDHHCEILQNCVGAYNHRFFMQFIVYLFIIITLFLYHTYGNFDKLIEYKVIIELSWFIALLIYCWLIYRLIIPQFRQLFINQVYIERKFGIFMNIDNYFDTGSVYKNIQIIMGSSILGWFIPMEWTKFDLKQRLIDTNYKSYDLCKSTVQLRDAADLYKQRKFYDNKKKEHY